MEMIAEQILSTCAKHGIGIVSAQILLAVAKNGIIRAKDIRKHMIPNEAYAIYMVAAALCKNGLLDRHKEPGESYRYFVTTAGMGIVQAILDAQSPAPAPDPAPVHDPGPLLPL